ncbi:hypothetical protein BDZ89DRAFT_1042464 [Hymenopellis radicata]|nr:hypothetical protein BDZ89DRAFT_1042464 [Hymenopellis radicata]
MNELQMTRTTSLDRIAASSRSRTSLAELYTLFSKDFLLTTVFEYSQVDRPNNCIWDLRPRKKSHFQAQRVAVGIQEKEGTVSLRRKKAQGATDLATATNATPTRAKITRSLPGVLRVQLLYTRFGGQCPRTKGAMSHRRGLSSAAVRAFMLLVGGMFLTGGQGFWPSDVNKNVLHNRIQHASLVHLEGF